MEILIALFGFGIILACIAIIVAFVGVGFFLTISGVVLLTAKYIVPILCFAFVLWLISLFISNIALGITLVVGIGIVLWFIADDSEKHLIE